MATDLRIVEGIEGTFHYHLCEFRMDGVMQTALCGRKHIMPTSCKLKDWGYVGHLKERWCKECERMWL